MFQEEPRQLGDPAMKDDDVLVDLLPTGLAVKAGFALSDSNDPRYQIVVKHRAHFGQVIHQAAAALRGNIGGEDHIDAVIGKSFSHS